MARAFAKATATSSHQQDAAALMPETDQEEETLRLLVDVLKEKLQQDVGMTTDEMIAIAMKAKEASKRLSDYLEKREATKHQDRTNTGSNTNISQEMQLSLVS